MRRSEENVSRPSEAETEQRTSSSIYIYRERARERESSISSPWLLVEAAAVVVEVVAVVSADVR